MSQSKDEADKAAPSVSVLFVCLGNICAYLYSFKIAILT